VPKLIEHPRSSLPRSIALAEAIDHLGGEATIESAADAMGNKVGGAFRALISGASKYNLVSLNKGRLKTEALFRDWKLAYSENEKQDALRRAFLSAPLFDAIAKRLDGKPIPGHFENLLIREYSVPEDDASKVAGYFVEGARMSGIVGAGGVISVGSNGPPASTSSTIVPTSATSFPQNQFATDLEDVASGLAPLPTKNQDCMTVRIVGLGMDEKVNIETEEDLEIVEVLLKKARRLLKNKEATELAG
jgi:hypothetical protein